MATWTEVASSIFGPASPGLARRAAVAVVMLLAATAPASGQSSPPAGGAVSPAPQGAPDSQEPRRRVLFLYGEQRQLPAVAAVDQIMRSILETRSPVPVSIYTEFLDINLFDGTVPHRELRELLRRKYETRPLDLIVAGGGLALRIAVHNRADLFSNAPIVFVSVDRAVTDGLALGDDVTGTWMHQGWMETFDLARRLHPETRRVIVVTGSSLAERDWRDAARKQFAAYTGPIAISYRTDRRLEDVLEEVAALPKGTVVIVGAFVRDTTGRDFTTPEVTKRIAAVATVPIYGLTGNSIGTGVVGGHVVSFEAHGRVAADLALRVLAGERPPPTDAGTTVATVDDRQVTRWAVDRRRVPPGSVVRFHEPSLWELYRGYVVGAVSVFLVQSGLIAALVVQRVRRRRAERNLAERLRFETHLADLSAALASCPVAEVDRELETGLRRMVEDLGTDRATLWSFEAGGARVTHSWTRPGVPPMATIIRESQFSSVFARIRQGDVLRLPPRGAPGEAPTDGQSLAQIRTRSSAVAPLIEGGVVVGGLSVDTVEEERRWPDELLPRLRLLADIFANALARQRAERAVRESAKDIRDLAGRLMTAQEDERRRIARQLHDGVNQDLAALSIALSALENGLPAGASEDRRQEIARLQGRTVELAEAIRHLSHELHPGILQYTGLASALRSHCREFERDQGLPVTFRADDDLGVVPSDVALCLYRVTQEALRNAARHAKAGQVQVALTRDGADLVLAIRDDGRGFDLAEARGRGLGLISLGERVRLAGGRLAIDTQAERGTHIHVVVPLG